ncbi:DUF262 domain-containing protein [Dickeya fangzhongdai]|uniref:DUF262 domain-containing protein n=1 Tax=Dickeya fangzhongdai TaxID=1778540 RepID=UPI0013714D80|nr:DUF262 domain-containing protein [Dickeya fangzhongdai]UMB75363.1 DUF262 domain-containing protein [Dickeya fangzhongdai]
MNIADFYDDDEMDFADKEESEDDEDGDSIQIPKEERILRTQSYDKSISDLVSMIDDGEIDLNPEFQRNYLWDNKKSSLLIESVLLNIPIPVIYASENEDAIWSVIDGLQRLNSIHRFFKNEFRLTKLEILKELNGLTYHKLPPKAQRLLKNGLFRVIVLQSETHEEIKYDIFMRLNTGAVKLNEQELRNCLYRGSLNKFLKRIRENESYLSFLKLKSPHKRFTDCEMILRFLALYDAYDFDKHELVYPGKMKPFLNAFMRKYQNASDDKLNFLEGVFEKAVSNAYMIFGSNAFMRPNKRGEYDGRVNRSLMDVVMLCCTRLDKEYCRENSNEIKQSIIDLCVNDSDFIDAITSGTSDKRKISFRIEKGLNALGVD